MSLVTEAGEPPYIKIVYRGMEKLGWIAGKNIVYVRPQSFDDPARFADAARELVRSKVDLIYADSAPAMRAAQAATREIPIVGTDYTNDPVAVGYAKTYHRPGGNITGVFLDAPQFAGNWIDLLRTILPDLKRAVALYDPSPGDRHLKALQAAARAAGIQLQIVEVHKPEDIDRAATMTLPGTPQAIIIVPSPMTYAENTRLARLARKQKLPATSMAPHFAGKGGLLAYGPDNSIVERLAVQISKILN
ncbi:MAG: hypothetical protein GTO41_06900, partial [Burkholderiales bacterium]|nr:hypothetical protein [Burkholderiales bacterium]